MKSEIKLLIEARYGDLRASEQKVANYILNDLSKVSKMSLRELSDQCNVSQPTVLRMAKAIGFAGLKEFRNAAVSYTHLTLPTT